MPPTHANLLPTLDLGLMPYADTMTIQQQTHQAVHAGTQSPCIILVEHQPVITLSKRRGASDHLLANSEKLKKLGIETASTNRGGDITYHGPGQLVAYPIVHLGKLRIDIGQYMRILENAIINTLATFGIDATTDPPNTGVWVIPTSPTPHPIPQKIAALGVRLRKQITMHGLALNITTDLSHFDTIIPCGLHDRTVTSMHALLNQSCPTMNAVKTALVTELSKQLTL